jgi:hypothetical protein
MCGQGSGLRWALGSGSRIISRFWRLAQKPVQSQQQNPNTLRSGWIHFNFAPGFAQRNSVYRQRGESKH